MKKLFKVIMISTGKKVHDTYMQDNLEYQTDGKLSYNGIQQHLYILDADAKLYPSDIAALNWGESGRMERLNEDGGLEKCFK